MTLVRESVPNIFFPFDTQNESLEMRNVAAVILAGGSGTRLFPLTLSRCKPAITFAGSLKLIDIPISNALNAGCKKIFVVSQYLANSLHQHIISTFSRDNEILLLSAEQKPNKNSWYQGTADAVRQNIEYFKDGPEEYILILSGDQLYRMNFSALLAFAKKTDADLVVAAHPVNENEAKRMGIFRLDESFMACDFIEKPQNPETLLEFQSSLFPQNPFIASMGIYLFKKKALLKILKEDQREDFGKHLLPSQVKKGKIAAYLYNGYWEDIGTIASFYYANLLMTKPESKFQFENTQLFRSQKSLPSPKISSGEIFDSILAAGSTIKAKQIKSSIVGPRVAIGQGSILENSYFIGDDSTHFSQKKCVVGKNAVIQKTIVDSEVNIGDNVKLVNKNGLEHYDGEGIFIREGIIVVARGTILPSGFIL